jgi:hypothetical protein
MIRPLILTFGFAFAAFPALAQPVFPAVSVENLEGQALALPAQLPGSATIVFMAYSRAHQADVEAWVSSLWSGAEFIQMPVLGRGAALVRGMIDNGMRSGMTDANLRARTFTYYQSASTLNGPLEITDDGSVNILVVRRSGEVTWSTTGQLTQAALTELAAAYQAANR